MVKTARIRYGRRRAFNGITRGSSSTNPRLSKTFDWLERCAATLNGTATAAAVTVVNGTDSITWTGHGLATGDGPFSMDAVALPTGIDADNRMFIRVTDANTVTVHETRKGALNDHAQIAFSDNGTTVTMAVHDDENAVLTLVSSGISSPDRMNQETDLDNIL